MQPRMAVTTEGLEGNMFKLEVETSAGGDHFMTSIISMKTQERT